jgi:2-keto-4-pentenoate hydratase/2-oxohepta-3-ene-1,7-dioic acid hydratase in catechol pathway
MKLVLWQPSAQAPAVGLLTPRGIVAIPDVERIEQIIDTFADRRADLERLANDGPAVPVASVRLMSPLPRPGKILCSTAVYGEAAPLLMTLKSAESVVGPEQTVQLPNVDATAWHFVPEAELGLVIHGPAKDVTANNWPSAVFGYTCVIDVMARGDTTFGRDFWLAKADTLGPLGPCIVTADEVPDPNLLRIRSWQNGQPRQDFINSSTGAAFPIGQQVEFATTIMTLHTGDVIACGTNPEGLQPLHHGDRIDVEIEHVGRLSVGVGVAV